VPLDLSAGVKLSTFCGPPIHNNSIISLQYSDYLDYFNQITVMRLQ